MHSVFNNLEAETDIIISLYLNFEYITSVFPTFSASSANITSTFVQQVGKDCPAAFLNQMAGKQIREIKYRENKLL